MTTGSQGRPDDLGKPKGNNNQLRPRNGGGAAGVIGARGHCTPEAQTCGAVLRQPSHSVVADA